MSAEVRIRARDPGRSCLVQAPAGSGKTELLTQRILALLAVVDEPEEILALTFTRKAAAEMRRRVLGALQSPKPAAAESHRMETWQLACRATARSEQRGWHLEAHPGRLRIMTLDSFTFALARQLPLLSGLGEMPTPSEHVAALYRQAAEAALNEALRDYPDAAARVLLHQDHNAVAAIALLAEMLAKREQWLEYVAGHARDMDGLRAILETNLAAIMQQRLQECAGLMPQMARAELPALMRFAGEQLGDQALQSMRSWPDCRLEALPLWQYMADFLLLKDKAQFRRQVNKNSGFPAGKAFAAQKQQMQALLDLLEPDRPLADALHALRALPQTAAIDPGQWQVLEALFLLLVLANAQLRRLFAGRGEADFTEIALRAMQALGRDEHAPGELLLKLDYRIRHILVDEFQDTSLLQMRLLRKLTDGWQAGDGTHRTLFMVGDPMQSIYRFRKAEVGLFLNAAANEADLPPVEALQLERNFRSAPAIVDWVNRAFRAIFPAHQDVICGAVAHAPARPALAHAGRVTLHLQQGPGPLQQAAAVARLVEAELAADPALRIGILARSRKHLHEIMPALSAAGIAFRAIEILPLQRRPEVRLLRALLRALLHPADRASWAALLRARCCGLESRDLHVLIGGDTQPIWLLINSERVRRLSADGQRRVESLRWALAPCVDVSGRVAVRRLIESAWQRLAMPSLIDATARLNADAVFALIESLQNGGRIDFALFDERLQQLYAAPDTSEAAGRVELLTMHGAKGLQWDCVILPGLGYGGGRSDAPLLAFSEVPVAGRAMPLIAVKAATRSRDALYDLVRSVEQSKSDHELQRLLYVACTRAETALHLFGHVSEKSGRAEVGSLLQLLLEHDDGCFGAEVVEVDSEAAAPPEAVSQLLRIATPQPAMDAGRPDTARADERPLSAEPEYLWAGPEAAPVGNAMHALLQQIADVGREAWSDAQTDRALRQARQLLIADGLSGALLDSAYTRCVAGLERVLQSSRAGWILSGRHQDAHSEWALSLGGERVSHHVIDRSFVAPDEQGRAVRWIIDYKSGAHEGGDLERFLLEESERHAAQLQRYASLLMRMQPELLVRCALYFPMLDAWTEVT